MLISRKSIPKFWQFPLILIILILPGQEPLDLMEVVLSDMFFVSFIKGVGDLNIPLVADTSKTISKSYGVLVEDEDDGMYGAALRGLFFIDPNGMIRSIQINDDQVGRSVEESLRLLKAFQWADSHVGEACPASWTPGQDTIKTNPYEAKEYFKTHFK